MDASLEQVRHQMVQLLPRLRRFAIALTGSAADGDDLVQDTLERALKNLHAWEPGTRLDSWMFRIAKNRFIDTRRSLSRRKTEALDMVEEIAATDGEQAMQSHLALQDTAKALRALPLDQRQAVALVLVDGRSYREAADILDIPIGTLTSRISRAREALIAALEG